MGNEKKICLEDLKDTKNFSTSREVKQIHKGWSGDTSFMLKQLMEKNSFYELLV